MFKLIIKKTGKLYKEIVLSDKDEYLIGRGKDSDIILPKQHNISRRHIQLKKTPDGDWSFVNLSETNPLIFNGEEVADGVLEDGQSFYLQNYEFCLLKDASPVGLSDGTSPADGVLSSEVEVDAVKENPSTQPGFVGTPQLETPKIEKNSPVKSSNELALSPEDSEPVSASDKTTIMNMGGGGEGEGVEGKNPNQLTAYLKIFSIGEGSDAEDIFKLDGQSEWIIGRDKASDMIIESPNMSRKHFKIHQKNNRYYITDLKSANGTILNDKKLSSGKNYLIQTGDIINILDVEMSFEIKNLALVRQLSTMKAPPPSVNSSKELVRGGNSPSALSPIDQPLPAHIPKVIMENAEDAIQPSFLKKNKKKILIYGSCLLIIGFFFFSSQKKSSHPESLVGPVEIQEGELAGLTPEKQEMVKDTFYAATQFYIQGKFAHCRRELEKVHKYTDNYQNSKKLDITCAQAAENHQRKIDLEEKKKKAKETDQMIQKITQNCQDKFDSFKFKHELTSCLSQAIDLSVADSRVQTLIERFEFNQLEKQRKKEKLLARRKLIQQVKKTHIRARSLKQSGQMEKSMLVYQKFIDKARYKELVSDKKQAKRELASIKKSYNDNINHLNKECANQLQSGKLKKAYYECQKAVEKIPEPRNKLAQQMMKTAQQKLQSNMKPLYESASLYESTGNISTAQEKWKKIMNEDIKEGLYYQRAKIKLSKY